MAQPTETDDANAVRGLRAVGVEHVEDGGAGAHERGSFLVRELAGNLEEAAFLLDDAVRQAALVQVGPAVHFALGAEGLGAVEALRAVAAGVLQEAPAYPVALFELADGGARGCYDADALVAEDHLVVWLVLVEESEREGGETCVITPENEIAAAEPGGCDGDEDLVVG